MKTLTQCAALALGVSLLLQSSTARAVSITTPVSLPTGSFSGTLSGSGGATITGASGNYKQHLPHVFGQHVGSTNIGLTAANQTVGISMPTVNLANNVASGSANIDYDNVAPGTPQALNSLSADMNGAGGSNVAYPFSISVDPLVINIASIVDADLNLTVNGSITDVTFTSTGSSPASPVFAIDGVLNMTLEATVSGSLDLGALGNVSLGTIFSLASTTIPVPLTLPGAMLLTDLSGGLGPYPANMGVDLGAAIPFPISAPLDLPFDVNQSFSVGTHDSGITQLIVNSGSMLNLDMTFGNPAYQLSGVVPVALVPEPGAIALSSMALLGLVGMIWRRKRAA